MGQDRCDLQTATGAHLQNLSHEENPALTTLPKRKKGSQKLNFPSGLLAGASMTDPYVRGIDCPVGRENAGFL
jgi:hypothetical protein